MAQGDGEGLQDRLYSPRLPAGLPKSSIEEPYHTRELREVPRRSLRKLCKGQMCSWFYSKVNRWHMPEF